MVDFGRSQHKGDNIYEQAKKMMNEVLADDEFFDLTAKVLKKTYDSLIKNGFTVEQATQIVAHQDFKGN
jgi:hypothetical protein